MSIFTLAVAYFLVLERGCFRAFFYVVSKASEGFKLETTEAPYNRPCFFFSNLKYLNKNMDIKQLSEN